MNKDSIFVERSKYGVFAIANVFIKGKEERVTLTGKVGFPNEWDAKSDDEVKEIVIADWNAWKHLSAQINGKKGGQSRSAAKAAASINNGKKGGRRVK